MAGVSCLAFFFDVSAAFESIGTDRVPIFDRPVSGRETLSQLVFVLALHFVQHLPPSLPFSVLALSLLRISIIPDPTGSPWMPMTVRGCVPLCMYLDNEKCVYGILLRRISCFRVDRHGYIPIDNRSRRARDARSSTDGSSIQQATTRLRWLWEKLAPRGKHPSHRRPRCSPNSWTTCWTGFAGPANRLPPLQPPPNLSLSPSSGRGRPDPCVVLVAASSGPRRWS